MINDDLNDIIYTIYKITNDINGKNYIGVSGNFNRRWKHHKNLVKNGSQVLYVAFRKYGIDNFTCEAIYQSKEHDHTFNVMESHFIDVYSSYGRGYNMTKGGEGATRDFKPLSEQHKLNISRGNIGKKRTDESKKRYSIAKSGRSLSEATKLRLSIIKTGKPNPKNSLKLKGRIPWNKGLTRIEQQEKSRWLKQN